MAVPPVLVGAVHLAVAVMVPPAAPAPAVPIVGAPGTVVVVAACGVTVFEATDRVPSVVVPVLSARTRKLYAVPLVSPVTTVLFADGAIALIVLTTVVPVRTWTRYSESGAPPVLVGAVQLTVA